MMLTSLTSESAALSIAGEPVWVLQYLGRVSVLAQELFLSKDLALMRLLSRLRTLKDGDGVTLGRALLRILSLVSRHLLVSWVVACIHLRLGWAGLLGRLLGRLLGCRGCLGLRSHGCLNLLQTHHLATL